jgi:hypothetical protein
MKAPAVPFRPLRFLTSLLLVLLVAACARYSGPIEGDNRPHPGVDRARAMPIQGIDIARYQGRIDFDKVRSYGVHFVYMKATEGNDYIDPMFYDNWNRAKASGMAHGAYHFMTWCSTAAEQAAWFEKMVPVDPTALPPVLDLEWNHGSSCKKKFSKADMLEKIRVMLAAMEAHTGKLPIIYTDSVPPRYPGRGKLRQCVLGALDGGRAARPLRKARLDLLAVDADRHDAGRHRRGGPQRLFRHAGRLDRVPADRVRSARRADPRAERALPASQIRVLASVFGRI